MNLHRFDVNTIKNVELRRKTFKTTQNYKSNQIMTICIDLTSKRSKTLSYVAKHSKQRKTTKVIKIQWIASIWRRKDKKMLSYVAKHSKQRKTTKVIKLNELHRFDVKTIKNVERQNIQKRYKLQNTIASIWRHNDKNVELRRKTFKTTQNYKSDHITMNLHRFHVKTIKTTQNYKNDQITMNCIDLTS